MAEKHEVQKLDKPEHVSAKAYDGGQCLSGHLSRYTPDNSCSYRWQGLKKAGENKHIYNAHRGFNNASPEGYKIGAHKEVTYAKSSYDNGNSGQVKGDAKTFKSKKGKEMATFQALNFTNGRAPYKNDVHHILPSADLRDGLQSKVKEFDKIQHICNSLLEEKYNINHKDNSIILPKTNGHAAEIGLPTHANSHQAGYKEQLKTYIDNALDKALKTINDGSKGDGEHEVIDYIKVKKNFEKISKTLYRFLAKPNVEERQAIFKSSKGVLHLDILEGFPDINFK